MERGNFNDLCGLDVSKHKHQVAIIDDEGVLYEDNLINDQSSLMPSFVVFKPKTGPKWKLVI